MNLGGRWVTALASVYVMLLAGLCLFEWVATPAMEWLNSSQVAANSLVWSVLIGALVAPYLLVASITTLIGPMAFFSLGAVLIGSAWLFGKRSRMARGGLAPGSVALIMPVLQK